MSPGAREFKNITPAWLTSMFRESGVLGAAAVRSIAVEPIGIGVGFLGQLYSVIAIGSLDAASERGMKVFTGWLRRRGAAIEELDAGELIPQGSSASSSRRRKRTARRMRSVTPRCSS